MKKVVWAASKNADFNVENYSRLQTVLKAMKIEHVEIEFLLILPGNLNFLLEWLPVWILKLMIAAKGPYDSRFIVTSPVLAPVFASYKAQLFVFDPTSTAIFNLNRILFPVSIPESHGSAFEEILEFALKSKSSITLLYRSLVRGNHFRPKSVPFFPPKAMIQERYRISILRDWLTKAENAGVPIEIDLGGSHQDIYAAVLDKTATEAFDLVVFDRPTLEVNFARRKEIRKTPCPAWIAPNYPVAA